MGAPDEKTADKYGMDVATQSKAPNFWYKPLDFKVWLYKYIGRGVETNKTLTREEFESMKANCLTRASR